MQKNLPSKSSVFAQLFTNPKMLVVLLFGFASGLPLNLTGSTLQAWMTSEHINLKTIGLFSLAGLPYTLKFLWAPLLDRFVPPFLGRRRGWILIAQIGLMLGIVFLALSSPAQNLSLVVVTCCWITWMSATQDIAIDAHRREFLHDEQIGLGSSLAINGYRLAMLFSGALALFLADHFAWKWVYLIMASAMLVGVVNVLLSPEPVVNTSPPKTFLETVYEPFHEYFSRAGAFEILGFILLYKLGDVMATAMMTPFVLGLGFSKTDIAVIGKTFGLAATFVGGILGGLVLLKTSLKKALVGFGLFQLCSIFAFVWLALKGHHRPTLVFTIALENLASGMGTSAYAAFMATLTNKRFTATQFALLSSLMGVPRVLFASSTGYLAGALGWPLFFVSCSLMAIPGLLLLTRFSKWEVHPAE